MIVTPSCFLGDIAMRILAIVAAVALAFASPAAATSFTEGDWSGWTSMTYQGASGGQTAARQTAGGNPGAYYEVATGTNAATWTKHLNAAFTYDPSAGAIESIDISLDYLSLNTFGQGMGVRAVVAEQDGALFVSTYFITNGTNGDPWKTFTASGLTAADFGAVSGVAAIDFSESGAPITFGFGTSNGGGNGIRIGYDNYDLTLNTAAVPLPAALPMIGVAFATLAAVGRRGA
jgi:hypothetical protein